MLGAFQLSRRRFFGCFIPKLSRPTRPQQSLRPILLWLYSPESKKQYNSAFEQSAEHRLGRGYFPVFFSNFKFDQLRINTKHEDSAGKQSYLITLKYSKLNCFDSMYFKRCRSFSLWWRGSPCLFVTRRNWLKPFNRKRWRLRSVTKPAATTTMNSVGTNRWPSSWNPQRSGTFKNSSKTIEFWMN